MFQLFLRRSDGSNTGNWAVTDCKPDDVACGGNAHKLLISPTTNCVDHCVHDLPQKGWQFCSGEITTGGICLKYEFDDTIDFSCQG